MRKEDDGTKNKQNIVEDKDKGNDNLRVMFFNARSIRNKMDELKIMVKENRPEVIAIVESWLTESIFDSEITIENYNFIRMDRKHEYKEKGGGIIVYIQENLTFVNCTEEFCHNIDHLWISVMDKGLNNIMVGIFYRPPDSNEEDLGFLVRNLKKFKSARTIVVGDFNYADIDWKRNTSGTSGKKFLKELNDIALHQCVKYQTRGKNILDLVLVYDKEFIGQVTQTAPLGKGDHNVIMVKLNAVYKVHEKNVVSFRYNKAKYDDLENRINKIDWKERLENSSVDEVWNILITILNNFKDNNIPKTVRNVDKEVPWITKSIKVLIKRRNNLLKRFKKTNLYYFKSKYNVARNLVTKRIRSAKSRYESKIIRRSKNNRKVFYSYIATRNRKASGRKVGPIVKKGLNGKDKEIVAQDVEVASLLNDYFISVFNKKDNIETTEAKEDISSQTKGLEKIDITQGDVSRAIGEFKVNKSPGVDKISSTYALKIKDIVSEPLALLFNKSLMNKEIPMDWKKANITPIFKKGDRSNMENYRPVSLTVLFGKAMERIIKTHVEEYLKENNIITGSQHGFRKGRSCLSNLLISQDSIIKMLDEGSAVDVIYLDLQKAFDKVPHDKLMKKVRATGIGGEVAHWIEAWLTNRVQRVLVGNGCSEWKEVSSGVPQGSILGPLLFSIFINDLDNGLRNAVLKFADDTKVWGRVDNAEDVRNMQDDLRKIGLWSEENHMPFNVGKCRVMYLGVKNMKADYKLLGQGIEETKEEKDLGVIFSDSFKPTSNCSKASKSANKIVGLIRRNIINKTQDEMLILYKTLIRPILDYCIPVWRPFLKKDIKQLERIQRRFSKMIIGCKKKNYEQRLEMLNLTTLEERHHRADMIQVYKILNDKSNVYPINFLQLSDRPGRKNSMKLYKRRNRLELCRNSFTARVVDRWNDLPDKVILSNDVNMFKCRFDCHMREARGQT